MRWGGPRVGLVVFVVGVAVAGAGTAASASVSAQLLRPTEASDRVFEALERARAFGLLDTIPMGQRVGLERALRRALSAGADDAPGIDALRRLVFRPALAAGLEFTYALTDVTRRSIPDNGLGGIDGDTAPLLEARGGRLLDDGSNWAIEPGVAWRSGEWAFQLRSRVRWVQGEGSDPAEGRVQELWAEGPLGPLYISVGRAPLVWGPSPVGGSMLSGHARALDQVSVASDGTFRFPWIFRHMGPARLSLSIARMDGARNIPHSLLVGYKLSYKPVSSLELGATVLVQSGGDGAPSTSFGRRLLDHLVLFERFTTDADLEISNKLAGGDVRWQVPGTRGSQIYAAMTVDDFGKNSELGRVFRQDAAYIGGLAIPRLVDDGSVGLRAEYRNTSIRFYRHGQFSSGLTVDRTVIGDPLGPDGKGAYLALDARPSDLDRITFLLAREERSNDFYVGETTSDGDLEFLKESDLPEETRTRLELTWERHWSGRPFGGATTVLRVGYEHVSDFGFEAGREGDGAVLELRATVGFAGQR